MNRDIIKCKVTTSGKVSCAVKVPVAYADLFSAGTRFTIALDDKEIEWIVPLSFNGQSASGYKCRAITKWQIREWLKQKQLNIPGGIVFMRYLGENRIRLATDWNCLPSS